MYINWIGVLFIGYISVGVVKGDAESCTRLPGLTWECPDCESIKGLSNWTLCAEKCLSESWCVGYTWEKNDVAGSMCFLFKELKNQHACDDCTKCISGTFQKINGICNAVGDDIVGTKQATTELECLHHCAEVEDCDFYSWSNSALMKNVCFLLKNCVVTKSCESFISGSPTCRLKDLPDECTNYKILNDQYRNVKSGNSYNCDSLKSPGRRGIWFGTNWYRMEEPAGTKMPESPPGIDHCGVDAPGWLNGTHPTSTGSSVKAEVCFEEKYYGPCHYKTDINITNCGGYFVYHLQEINSCSETKGYCAE